MRTVRKRLATQFKRGTHVDVTPSQSSLTAEPPI
jgi:hypothetical protein